MRYADIRNQQRAIDDREVMDLLAGPDRPTITTDPATLAWEERRREWLRERDKQRQEWEADPIGHERSQSWDPTGDVGRHPDIEWVPTEELRKFIEYDRRPGMEHDTGSPERYQALTDHIREHGFRNPVILNYNQDKGVAHMSEGNHRTWIALENGIPSMPVRVYRSRRDSETAIPVTLHPEPMWRDHKGEVYVPDSMKPSHIGLPTVPTPTWQRMAMTRHSATTMYHVAPRHARDSIMREGLLGHLERHTEEHTPWDRSLGQPAGNYLFAHLNHAQQYAATLAQKEHKGYPGDDPHQFHDHGIIVNRDPSEEHAHAYVERERPDDWDWDDDEANEAWEDDEDNFETYNGDKHADLLPPNLQGYDVWRVLLHGDQPLVPDPENALREMKWNQDRGEEPWQYYSPERVKQEIADDSDEHGFMGDATWPRWLTPSHVDPSQMSVHEHIPAWKINDLYAENKLEEGSEFEKPLVHDFLDPASYAPNVPRPYENWHRGAAEAPSVRSEGLLDSKGSDHTWERL